mmetsp:Transcript_115894/g.322691  ORF Transcript_115894/g.322691 Transcript_115894/m.322691 type:complete len:681 (-) Transcript_115894:84-2126(-)
MWLAPRLWWHTLVAATLLGSFVLGPLVLLLRQELGFPALALGLTLLAVGCAALLGAAICRGIDRNACSRWQWRSILLAAWLLNPVLVVALAVFTGHLEAAWWSGVPLAFALVVLCGRLQLVEGDPNWAQEGCPPSTAMLVHWFFSRLVFIGIPLCLLSFQVALYLPAFRMLPQGPEVGLFVCGGCILISAKFCVMCACLARQKLSQFFVLVVLLSADWVSSLHLMMLITDELKAALLLAHLLLAGLIQLRAGLARMRLRQRWARAFAQRRAREAGAGNDLLDAELGAHANGGPGGPESTDSDDERGPGSLQDGFHEALAGLLGVPPASAQRLRRQWLCGVRSACVQQDQGGVEGTSVRDADGSGAGIGLSEMSPTATGAASDSASQESAAAAPLAGARHPAGVAASGEVGQSPALEIPLAEKVCTVCQEEIKSGESVRPMPKCSHVFHAACLEGWAKTMREATTCPTCRRPALARKQADGATSIASLAASGSTTREGSQGSARGRTSASAGSRGGEERSAQGTAAHTRRVRASQTPAGRPSGPRSGRGYNRDSSVATLRHSLGISEALAQAALEISEGAPDVAAHVLLEHRSLLVSSFGGAEAAPRPQRPAEVPAGVLEAVLRANPDLAGAEAALRRHLADLYRDGRLQAASWPELPAAGRVEVFRVLLADVVRRLEERR